MLNKRLGYLAQTDRHGQAAFLRSREKKIQDQLMGYNILSQFILPQTTFCNMTPLQAMEGWHKIKSALFKKQQYNCQGCDQ